MDLQAAKTAASDDISVLDRLACLEREHKSTVRSSHHALSGLSDRLIDLGAAVAEFPPAAKLHGMSVIIDQRLAEFDARLSSVERRTIEAKSEFSGLRSRVEESEKDQQKILVDKIERDLQGHFAKADKNAQMLVSRCDSLSTDIWELTSKHKVFAAEVRGDAESNVELRALVAQCDQVCKNMSATVKQCQHDVADMGHRSREDLGGLHQKCRENKSLLDHVAKQVTALDQQCREDVSSLNKHCRGIMACIGRRDDIEFTSTRPPWRPWPAGKRTGGVPSPRYVAQMTMTAQSGGDVLPTLPGERCSTPDRGFDIL